MTEKTAKSPRVDARSPIRGARLILNALRRRSPDRYVITRQARKGDPGAVEAARLADEAIRRGVGVHEVALRSGELVETLLDDRASLRGMLRDLKEDLRLALSQFSSFKAAMGLLLGLGDGQEISEADLTREIIDRNTSITLLKEKIRGLESERNLLAARHREVEERLGQEIKDRATFNSVFIRVREELERTKRDIETAKGELADLRTREGEKAELQRSKTDSLIRMEKDLDAKDEELAKARTEAEELRRKLTRKLVEIAEAKQELETLRAKQREQEKALAEKIAELNQARADIAEKDGQLEELTARTNQALDEARQALETERGETRTLRAKNTTLEGQLQQVQADLEKAQREGEALRKEIERVQAPPAPPAPPPVPPQVFEIVSSNVIRDSKLGDGWALRTDAGKNQSNADSAGIRKGHRFDAYVVADGGPGVGESQAEAGRIVIEELLKTVKLLEPSQPQSPEANVIVAEELFDLKEAVVQAVVSANTAITTASSGKKEKSLAAFSAVIHDKKDNKLFVINCGSTSVKLFAGGESQSALTVARPHTLHMEAYERAHPRLAKEASWTDAQMRGYEEHAQAVDKKEGKAIASAVGGNGSLPQLTITEIPLAPADPTARQIILLKSDGVTSRPNIVGAEEAVSRVVSPQEQLARIVERLVSQAINEGSRDNITALAIALAGCELASARNIERFVYRSSDGEVLAFNRRASSVSPPEPSSGSSGDSREGSGDGTRAQRVGRTGKAGEDAGRVSATPPIVFNRSDGLEDHEYDGGHFAIASRKGVNLRRPTNEDSEGYARLADGTQIYCLADGAGGMGNGDVASANAVQSYLYARQQGSGMIEAFQYACKQVQQGASTFVVAEVAGNGSEMKVLSSGDSRAKVVDLQAQTGTVLTADENFRMSGWVNERLLEGDMQIAEKRRDIVLVRPLSDEEMGSYESWDRPDGGIFSKSSLNHYLGNKDEKLPPVFVRTIPIVQSKGKSLAKLLLYCDGLVDGTTESGITAMVAKKPADAIKVVQRLTNESLRPDEETGKKASGDNVSVIVAELPGRPDLGAVQTEYFVPDPSGDYVKRPMPAFIYPSASLPLGQRLVGIAQAIGSETFPWTAGNGSLNLWERKLVRGGYGEFRGYCQVDTDQLPDVIPIVFEALQATRQSAAFKFLGGRVSYDEYLGTEFKQRKLYGTYHGLKEGDAVLAFYAANGEVIRDILLKISRHPQWVEIEMERIRRGHHARHTGTSAYIDESGQEWRTLGYNLTRAGDIREGFAEDARRRAAQAGIDWRELSEVEGTSTLRLEQQNLHPRRINVVTTIGGMFASAWGSLFGKEAAEADRREVRMLEYYERELQGALRSRLVNILRPYMNPEGNIEIHIANNVTPQLLEANLPAFRRLLEERITAVSNFQRIYIMFGSGEGGVRLSFRTNGNLPEDWKQGFNLQ